VLPATMATGKECSIGWSMHGNEIVLNSVDPLGKFCVDQLSLEWLRWDLVLRSYLPHSDEYSGALGLMNM